jgi:hypothetical protein
MLGSVVLESMGFAFRSTHLTSYAKPYPAADTLHSLHALASGRLFSIPSRCLLIPLNSMGAASDKGHYWLFRQQESMVLDGEMHWAAWTL